MKKLFFFLLLSSPLQAALVTKDFAVVTDGPTGAVLVRFFYEYDDITLHLSTSPLHCINNTNKNASFKFDLYGTAPANEAVFPANTTGTGLFNGSTGLITITNLSKNQFDNLHGSFVWPR